jgi:hypothetical protein
MRKVIITIGLAVLVLAASVSQASVVFFDTADPMVMPGETISVTIFSTVITTQIRMDRISDADSGTASNLYLNPGYYEIISEGTLVNTNGILIEDVLTLAPPVPPEISGVLYSFDYTVPIAPFGHTITIFGDPSDEAINQISCFVDNDYVRLTPESLTLTVIPEPTSIVLLGIGSLLLAKS